MKNFIARIVKLSPFLVLAACGGGGSDASGGSVPATAYTVGGALSGLGVGKSVSLRNNGVDNLLLTVDGSFVFAAAITGGSSYNVTVLTQPAGQTCIVSGGTGIIGTNNVTNVSVTCTNNASSNWDQLIWGTDNWA